MVLLGRIGLKGGGSLAEEGSIPNGVLAGAGLAPPIYPVHAREERRPASTAERRTHAADSGASPPARAARLVDATRSVLVAFTARDEIFPDAVLATALLDRLLHHATTINIRSENYPPSSNADGLSNSKPVDLSTSELTLTIRHPLAQPIADGVHHLMRGNRPLEQSPLTPLQAEATPTLQAPAESGETEALSHLPRARRQSESLDVIYFKILD